jgi:hypothetical protein
MIEELYQASSMLLYFSSLLIIACAFFYFLRKRGNFRSNIFLALFFIAFGLALVRNGLILNGQIGTDDVLSSVLWNTIWFGPLFFYYIKINIYPHYILRGSDLKHFVLPIAQTLTHILISIQALSNAEYLNGYFKYLYSIEGVIFLLTFFPYIILSFRYIKYAGVSEPNQPYWRQQKLLWLKRITKVLYVLAFVNSTYVITNFLSKFIFTNELTSLPSYFLFAEFSFSLIAIWIAYQAVKLVIGRAYSYTMESQNLSGWEVLLKKEKIFLDADLNVFQFLNKKDEQEQLFNGVRKERAAYLRSLRTQQKYSKHELKSLIYRSGYPNHWIYKK